MSDPNRLPKDVKPEIYHLELSPDLETFIVHGHLKILVDVKNVTNVIALHAIDIKFLDVSFQEGENPDAEKLQPVSSEIDKDTEICSIVFSNPLQTGKGQLEISFESELNDKMCGFYRSKYEYEGKERYMATTQFESTDARRCFPCWDEPNLKAKFNVTLVVPEDSGTTISGMEIISQECVGSGLRKVVFAETPIMSTYLLAFIIGHFDNVSDKAANGTVVRVFTPPGQTDQGKFALEVGVKCLDYFTEYFGVPYPLSKMDMIAIPDFAAGAMENWGAITFRTNALLIDPVNSSLMLKQRVAYVVAHEIAHQWFGNLVTMDWWTHLWLNEGFATWVGTLAVDHIFPEYNVWEQFIHDDLGSALNLDALRSSHPIEVEVHNSNEVQEIFDTISYSKGASVIRMLHEYVGEEAFKAGLHDYLVAHQHQNAVTEDLWEALEKACMKPIKEVMTCWTKKEGYPVIKVSLKEGEEKKTKPGEMVTIIAEQSRFLSTGDVIEEENFLYQIPLTVVGSDISLLMKERKMSFEVPLAGDEFGYFKANSGSTGTFRVSYSSELLRRAVLALPSMKTTDRLGILADAFALAKAGYASTVDALTLARDGYSKTETEYSVWADLGSDVGEVLSVWGAALPDSETYSNLRKIVGDMYGPMWAKLGWESKDDEPAPTKLLRPLVLQAMCSYAEDGSVLGEVKSKFEDFVSNHANSQLNPDLRAAVLSNAVRAGGEKEWKAAQKLYRETKTQELRIKCLVAMCCTKDSKLIRETLEFGLSDEVRNQDVIYVHRILGSSKYARALNWAYVKEEWSEYEKRFGSGNFLLDFIIEASLSGFAQQDMVTDIKEFFEKHPTPQAKRTIEQCLESIDIRIRWVERDGDALAKWVIS